MSDIHHLLIPYAACMSEGCQQALTDLRLPHLNFLLSRMSPAQNSPGDATSFSMPHERAVAQALGLPLTDGCIPWAAWQRLEQGCSQGTAWAFVTPCQWQVTTDHITLQDPVALGLDEAASRELMAIVAPWFTEDGIALHYEQPTRWLARGDVFDGLATASLERVVHCDVRAWMPPASQARTLHRLHSEMQMLLYTHPFNDARIERGLPMVNSFWMHGAGRWPAGLPIAAMPEMPYALRDAALRGDWPAWAAAWAALDAGPVAALQAHVARGGHARLTLCGERSTMSWNTAPKGWTQRIRSIFTPQRLNSLHEQL